MDAVSAFLQGEIDTDIYMEQPEQNEQGSQMCTIYGLKQACRLWNLKLNYDLRKMGCNSQSHIFVSTAVQRRTPLSIYLDCFFRLKNT